MLLGDSEAALAAAGEAVGLAEEEDLRELRAQGLRLRGRLLTKQAEHKSEISWL